MSVPLTDPPAIDPAWLRRVYRGHIIGIAVIGLLLGIIGFIFPDATLLTVAVIFGAFLVASGVFRLVTAFIAHTMTASLRGLSAVMGVLLVVAGVIALANPFGTLLALGIVIGLGWIIDGVVDFVLGLRRATHPRWFGFVSGIVSIAAGVAMFVLPATSIATLVVIGSVLLIVLSATTLLTLPGRTRTPEDTSATV